MTDGALTIERRVVVGVIPVVWCVVPAVGVGTEIAGLAGAG